MSIDRYTATKKTTLGKFKTTRYPKFKKQSTDLYITSRDMDRLDLLANEFYNDPRYWWVIAEANNLGKGTFNITPGLQIRIPFPITDLTHKLKESENER
ncbi:MAG: hypothetical protein H8E55_48410 [Pelagibacterales bacterium]|nr:hypothetical protein [Pelagibacterales bacterium]